jgi:hypothetical protein
MRVTTLATEQKLPKLQARRRYHEQGTGKTRARGRRLSSDSASCRGRDLALLGKIEGDDRDAHIHPCNALKTPAARAFPVRARTARRG